MSISFICKYGCHFKKAGGGWGCGGGVGRRLREGVRLPPPPTLHFEGSDVITVCASPPILLAPAGQGGCTRIQKGTNKSLEDQLDLSSTFRQDIAKRPAHVN